MRITTMLGGLAVAAFGIGVGNAIPKKPNTNSSSSILVGKTLASAIVVDRTGRKVDLLARGRPQLIVFIRAEDCLGCADISTESRVYRGHFPNVDVSYVVAGVNDSTAIEYFRRNRIADLLYHDPNGRLTKAIAPRVTPAAILFNAAHRIVHVDIRSAPDYSRIAPSDLLIGLREALASGPRLQDSASNVAAERTSTRRDK